MSNHSRELIVPDDLSLEQLRDQLAQQLKLANGANKQCSRGYWDSYDWRVYAVGGVLADEHNDSSHILSWYDLTTGDERFRQQLEGAPGFADGLADGALKEALLPLLEMRTLLPLVRIDSQVSTLNLLNEDDKTVVRLQFTENRFSAPDGDLQGPLGKRLRLVPVRGYDDEFDAVAALLELEPADGDQFIEALAAVGRTPEDYSSKLNYSLSPGERADVATKTILKGLLATLEANVDGTRANLDSEFLHDLRVATRRTRSALTQIKGVFPQEVVETYKDRFAWLGQVSSPVRDLDVYLLDFDHYQQSLPVSLQPHLEPMRDFLQSHYKEEQATLVRKLKSPHFHRLMREWRRFLEAPVPAKPGAANAALSVKVLADQRIWKMYRRVHKEGRAINSDAHPEALHDLRKSCKKLRYLMEFFHSLYPKGDVKRLIKALKQLLDNLGNFQDLAVQAEKLRDMAHTMEANGQANVDTLLAMGTLVGGLLERQHQARVEFARIFANFDTDANRDAYKSLFRDHKSGTDHSEEG